MPSLILTFENDSQRDEFIQLSQELTTQYASSDDTIQQERLQKTTLLLKTFNTVVAIHDPSPTAVPTCGTCSTCSTCDCPTTHNEKHALFVSGKKMTEGTLPEMHKLFKQEIDQHSGSVQVRVFRDNAWTAVMQRVKR